jgi:hypothetical protein
MSKGNEKGTGAGSPPPGSKYLQAAEELLTLTEPERRRRLAIVHGANCHVQDEVVALLSIRSWREGWGDTDVYGGVLLQRLAKHVRAHIRQNPGWEQRAGGLNAATDDFCGDIVNALFGNEAHQRHAGNAFGDYVWKRCLDCADKLYAKKRDAGESLDVEGVEAEAHEGERDDLPAGQKSPEDLLIEIERIWREEKLLNQIQNIAQTELPEKERIAFGFRFYGELRVFSKDRDKITVAKLMCVPERTAWHYINSAVRIIKEKLK